MYMVGFEFVRSESNSQTLNKTSMISLTTNVTYYDTKLMDLKRPDWLQGKTKFWKEDAYRDFAQSVLS